MVEPAPAPVAPAPVVIVEAPKPEPPKPEPVVIQQPVVIETPVPPAPVQIVQVVEQPKPAPSINWLWYEDDLDPNDDEFFDMDARQRSADAQVDDAVIDGWIESDTNPPGPTEIEDLYRNRPISA